MKWALTKRLIENDLAIEALIFNTKDEAEDAYLRTLADDENDYCYWLVEEMEWEGME